MKNTNKRWAIVTGASKGLGRSLSCKLASEGYNLILAARDAGLLEQLSNEIGKFNIETIIIDGDITEDLFINKLLKVCSGKQIDVLINNAGIVSVKPLEEMGEDEIEKVIKINLIAPMKIARALLPIFKKQDRGTIVNINSTASKKPALHHTAYCASKYGLRGFSEALRMELRDHGIRVIDIYPGRMRTELHKSAGLDLDTSTYLPPDDVAEMISKSIGMPESCNVTDLTIERMKQ